MTNRETAPPWTDEEIGFLQDHEDWPARQVGDALGRSRDAIYLMRSRLRRGWVRVAAEVWTEDEIAVLMESRWSTAEQLAEKLPGRTPAAIGKQRSVLGIDGGGKGNNKSPHQIGARPLLAKSCTLCGKLLQAEWFLFSTKKRQWSPSCRICEAARSTRQGTYTPKPGLNRRLSYQRFQALTLAKATRNGETWTDDDHKVLADPDLTLVQKALSLGRTYIATANACSRNGYKSHVGLGEPTDLWRIFNPNEPERVAA